MNRIVAFISYSSKEKVIGGKFKSYLKNFCGYETFIAHDDIPGSTIWEEEVIKAIKNADFFIPLISRNFKESPFTDQETGIAVCLNKKIIPIKLGEINPYGFIEKYQALQYKKYPSHYFLDDNIKELVLTITQIGLNYEPYHQKNINSLVYAFCKSNSFDATNATIKTMSNYNHFTSDHLKQIIQAIKSNSQVIGAFGLLKFKKFLYKIYNITID